MKIHTALTGIMAFLAMLGSIILVSKFASNPGTLDDERVQWLWGWGLVSIGIALGGLTGGRGWQWGIIAVIIAMTGLCIAAPHENWVDSVVILVLVLGGLFYATHEFVQRNVEPNPVSVLESAVCMWLPLATLLLLVRFSTEPADSLVILVVVGLLSVMLTPNKVMPKLSDSGRRSWAKPETQ